MTKRIVIASVFMAIAVFTSIFGTVYVSLASDKLLNSIDSTEEKILSGAEYEISDLTDLWEEYKGIFGIVLKHQDADTLDRYFIRLTDCEKGHITEILCELRAFLTVTSEGEKLKIENIF